MRIYPRIELDTMHGLLSDTIIAVSTPPGRGAISLLRLSGPQALKIVGGHVRIGLQPRRATPSAFYDTSGKVLDRVVATYFPSPRSFTGEDVVEVSCHGSPVVVRKLLETCLDDGARLADPGEFSRRAFLHGKLDLSQAEAIRDLVESTTLRQAQVALDQAEGRLAAELAPLNDTLLDVIAHLETSLEFVEEEVSPEGRSALVRKIDDTGRRLAELERTYRAGRLVRDGLQVAVTGKPNAGKSCLFNSLLRFERAIVTPVEGTTRDTLTETLDLEGIPVTLVDTAGIREVSDPVEQLGVERSYQALRRADLVLFLLDLSRPFEQPDGRIWQQVKGRTFLLVLNKCDLPRRLEVPAELGEACAASVEISALHGTHLQLLTAALLETALGDSQPEREGALLTNVRHLHCVQRCRDHLAKGGEALAAGLSEELCLYDLHKALHALGEITGETTVEDVLTRVFSTFCIGK